MSWLLRVSFSPCFKGKHKQTYALVGSPFLSDTHLIVKGILEAALKRPGSIWAVARNCTSSILTCPAGMPASGSLSLNGFHLASLKITPNRFPLKKKQPYQAMVEQIPKSFAQTCHKPWKWTGRSLSPTCNAINQVGP